MKNTVLKRYGNYTSLLLDIYNARSMNIVELRSMFPQDRKKTLSFASPLPELGLGQRSTDFVQSGWQISIERKQSQINPVVGRTT